MSGHSYVILLGISCYGISFSDLDPFHPPVRSEEWLFLEETRALCGDLPICSLIPNSHFSNLLVKEIFQKFFLLRQPGSMPSAFLLYVWFKTLCHRVCSMRYDLSLVFFETRPSLKFCYICSL